MFDLNLASLPNHILYLEGVQLSYIKVFVHIFNLWQSNNQCYISNPEFCRRTGLHRDTVIQAINFFERNGVFKRVQKGNKRYLLQTPKAIEIESEIVDNSPEECSNIVKGSELDDKGVGASLPKGSELAYHNIKTNIKNNKSFCSSNDKKINNQKPNSGFSNVECQSNSYNPNGPIRAVTMAPIMLEALAKLNKKG